MQLHELTTRIINGVARRYRPLQRYLDRRTRRRYIRGGRIPMSPGYEQFREELISKTLDDPLLMEGFRGGRRLPKGYGVAIDERCIEYPWLFSRLPTQRERLLDAGSVLNHAFLLERPLLADKKLHILTLAPEHAAFWKLGVSYLYEDLRAIPILDDYYDEIVCLSTLEHVSLDVSFYTGRQEHHEENPGGYLAAIRELRRVLKPGGTLYLSMPFGVYRDIGVMQVFDEKLLRRAIEELRPEETEVSYYLYTRQGWNVSTAEECAGAVYVDAYFRYFMAPPKQRPPELPREPDLAAAARAVVCARLKLGSKGQQP